MAMKPNPNQTEENGELRLRAEKRLKRLLTEVAGPGTVMETQRLVHELQVHQIELEMQNEELRESRVEVETALARYTDLYDFAPVGYFSLTANGTIRGVNLPGALLLGRERTRVLGVSFSAFVSDATRPIFESWLNQLFAKKSRHACILTLQREGESQIAVEIEATLSSSELEARLVVVDITDRKALEEKLQHAQKMEVVGQLAGGVAHEFNNIVAATLLNLEVLQMQHQLPAPTLSSLHDLETLAKRAGSLTKKLLLFSRRQPMQPVQLEINAVIKEVFKMLERLLDDNICFLRLASPRELWVDGDPAMLDQAVMNLCLNAKDAMRSGGTLTVEASLVEFDLESARTQPEARPGRFACLRVSDTGFGIEASVLKHLFEPFFTTKGVGEGSGLGLAAVYGIVHQHRGWISVESIPGHGASFRIYLPLSERAETVRTATVPLLSLTGNNETILLVEDEPALLLVNTRILTTLGYKILSATNGPEAIALWQLHHETIDLLLTDMRMPRGLSGLELAEKLRRTKPSLKVVIMSGYSLEIIRTCAGDQTDFTFLAKPFSLQTLSETLRHSFA